MRARWIELRTPRSADRVRSPWRTGDQHDSERAGLRRLVAESGGRVVPIQGIHEAAAAFGSILAEGNPVRLSGQDSERGTFSQRHAQFIDQVDEHIFTPLNNLDRQQAKFEVAENIPRLKRNQPDAVILDIKLGWFNCLDLFF